MCSNRYHSSLDWLSFNHYSIGLVHSALILCGSVLIGLFLAGLFDYWGVRNTVVVIESLGSFQI